MVLLYRASGLTVGWDEILPIVSVSFDAALVCLPEYTP